MPDNDYFEIQGGVPLRGSVTISGSKNAALPILCACVLAEDKCRIDNLPYIEDIQRILEILSQLGAGITDLGGGSIEIDPTTHPIICSARSSAATALRKSTSREAAR